MVTVQVRTGPDTVTTTAIQRRYDRQAPIYDLFEAPAELLIGRWRRHLWQLLPPEAQVLEIGVGTGKNLRWYPPGVTITAVDFSPQMLARAIGRAEKDRASTQFALMDAQALALYDESFDVAVATCVFCSVPDPVLGLREVRRVLRPDGRLLLLEHGRSELPVLGPSMDVISRLTVRVAGTNINREVVRNVGRAGFRVLEVEDLLLDIVKLVVAEPDGSWRR